MHRGRRLEDWVELAAAAVAKARGALGDDEVERRIAASVSDEDRETVVRVLRTLGRDLQAHGMDLTALDARLRMHDAPHVPAAPEDGGEGLTPGGPAARRGREATLGDLPPEALREDAERGAVRPADLAKRLARLRNPILPHPRHKPPAR
ncbi:hypothetical protein LG314_00785 [Agrococcus terreus]|uniref:hypothetical protein n=1 Tax=Agrococcus terreus TaxID=574649 RepID=UPI0038512CCB